MGHALVVSERLGEGYQGLLLIHVAKLAQMGHYVQAHFG